MLPDTVILAAGASSRMGSWKPALPWRGKNLLQNIVDTVQESGSIPIVVAGNSYRKILEILKIDKYVRVVYARNWVLGMSESLRAGIPYVNSGSFFTVPCDMPFLKPSDFQRLAHAHLDRSCRPILKGQPGHPVLLTPEDAKKILNCGNPSMPIKSILADSLFDFIEWDHEGVILDLDNEEDYKTYRL